MAAISLQGVCKHWGQAQAVAHIDFEVKSGQFTVLLGPSGCGKSTTLRLIVTNSVESRPLTVGLQVFSSTDQGVD